ncbi:MAG: hypothetical protein Q8N30_14130 [Methylococcales bacterium]|nr:hypothetical protein [Methylococcales bacterium]
MVGVAIVCEGKNDRDFLEEIINHHLGSDTKNINFYIFRGKSDLLQATHQRYENLQNLINAGQIKKFYLLWMRIIEKTIKFLVVMKIPKQV